MTEVARIAIVASIRIVTTVCVTMCVACSGNPPTLSSQGTNETRDDLVPTARLILTPTPTSEVTVVATPVSEPPVLGFERSVPMGFAGIELGAEGISGEGIQIIGAAEGVWNRLSEPDGGRPFVLRGWSRDGCYLVVEGFDRTIRLVNSVGSFERVVFRERMAAPDEHIVDKALSPDMTWVAYIVGRGEQGYFRYERQDVETAPIGDESSATYRLTTAGRAWEPAWSPRDNLLAYGDANEAGEPILVVTSPTGEGRSVLFESNDTGGEIREIRWSPTGEMVAFEILDRQENRQVWLASMHGGAEPLIMNDVAWIHDFWWQDPQTLGVYATPRDLDASKFSSPSVYWLNAADMAQLGQLGPGSTLGEEITQPGPLDAFRIGFFSGNAFVAYNFQTGETTKLYPRLDTDARWYSRPNEVGVEECS